VNDALHLSRVLPLLVVVTAAPVAWAQAPPPAALADALDRGDHAAVVALLAPLEQPEPAVALRLAASLVALGRLAEARAGLGRTPSGGPLGEHVLWARADLAVRLGDLAGARSLYSRIAARPGAILADRAAFRRAELTLALGQGAEAARQHARLRERFPRHPSPGRLILGELSGRQLAGDRAGAASLARRLLVHHPVDVAPDQRQRLEQALFPGGLTAALGPAEQRQRVLALARGGELDEALRLLQAPRALSGASEAELRLIRARALMSNHRYAAALAELKLAASGPQAPADVRASATRLLPLCANRAGDLDLLLGLAKGPGPAGANVPSVSAVHQRRGEYPEALKAARVRGGESDPFRLGYLAHRAGDQAAAAQRLHPLAQRARPHWAARYWLARTYLAAGDRPAGLAGLEALVREAPTDWYGLLARALLQRQPGRAVRAMRPVAPWPRRQRGQALALARTLSAAAPDVPALQRAAALLRVGLLAEAHVELSAWVGEQLRTTDPQGRGRTLRPLTPEAAWRPPGAAAAASARALPPRPGSPRLLTVVYRALVLLGDAYLANRIAVPGSDRPPLTFPQPFAPRVREVAAQARLSPGWVWSIMTVESVFCPTVVSPVGAIGLLQLMPLTARRARAALGRPAAGLEGLFDPAENLGLGAWYLGELARKLRGHLALAAAAYNGGPHNVTAWLRAKVGRAELDAFVEEIPFRETRAYVKRVVALAAGYAIELGEPLQDLVRLDLEPPIPGGIDF
jgi:soluble lytic murein transglycosylase